MQTLTRDSGSIFVAAPPDLVFAQLTDIQAMAEFSPELVSCRWLDGATGPAVGARFEAVNQLPGHGPWKNRPVVTVYEPDRRYAVSRSEPFAGTLVWSYALEPADGGTTVTESYEVTKPITRVGWFIIERLFGGTDRRTDLRRGIDETLSAVKTVCESRVSADDVTDQERNRAL